MTTRRIPDQARVPNAQQSGRPNRDSPALTRLPDPPKPPDSMQRFPHIARTYTILDAYYHDRPDVLVGGAGYLCYDASDLRRAPRPDCLIAFDVAIPPASIIEANGYTISEIGKPPDFVLEVASKSADKRDYKVKRDIYTSYRVGEQWRFDPTGGRYHYAPLTGELLVNGELAPIPVVTGTDGILRGYSEALGIELHWKRGVLNFWDPTTAEYLPDLTESKAQRDAAIQARRIFEAQRDVAVIQREAEAEAAARRAAEERARQLESQLRRLRGFPRARE